MFRGPCVNYFSVAGVIQLSSTYQLVLGVVGKGIPSNLGEKKLMTFIKSKRG